MEQAYPEFAPRQGLSRDEMEALQADVATAATFEDNLGFDPASISLDSPADDTPLVAGIDQAFLDDKAVSAVVVFSGGNVVERTAAVSGLDFPYIPGLLSFREGGPIIDALESLDADPDLLVFDGSGRIHYRQAGLATHMGVAFDTPSIGVAKSLLCGTPEADTDGRPAGWKTPIFADDSVDSVGGHGVTPETVIGYAYQSRQYDSRPIINPLYVSPGHRLSAETAVELIANLCGGYKLPEPTRQADAYADEAKASYTA
ncbi:endonuclease V [Haloferax sp. DFSO60]|uniref:endonuclease V n=1 Tax=Haloferax sp. DFSO60 TaxID=3388652 RepID=UPI00397A6758